MADAAGLHVHLDGQQQREERLVLLVEAARAVPPQLVRQVVDDVLDALRRAVALLGPVSEGGTRRAARHKVTDITALPRRRNEVRHKVTDIPERNDAGSAPSTGLAAQSTHRSS